MNNEEGNWISIDRIIEGVFVGLFLHGKKTLLVHWAPEGVLIPLKCRKCGAVFTTSNTPLGAVKYGDDYDKCKKCDEMLHGRELLVPNMLLYVRGRQK